MQREALISVIRKGGGIWISWISKGKEGDSLGEGTSMTKCEWKWNNCHEWGVWMTCFWIYVEGLKKKDWKISWIRMWRNLYDWETLKGLRICEWGLSWWSSGWDSALQCSRLGFDPWSWNYILHATTKIQINRITIFLMPLKEEYMNLQVFRNNNLKHEESSDLQEEESENQFIKSK